MQSLTLLLGVVLAVCGCASVAPPAPLAPPAPSAPPASPAPAAPADQRAAVPAALAVERQWLQSWFQGTPVLIVQRTDGTVSVDVPREFCFDPGRSSVKPALAVVLNKVAESLRRLPLARLSLLAAPEDATGTAALALQRAVEVHKHLLSHGVPAAHLGKPTAAVAAAVQLRIAAAPP